MLIVISFTIVGRYFVFHTHFVSVGVIAVVRLIIW